MLQLCSDTIAAQGSASDNYFGFVDGTVRPICRPAEHQRGVCNGHKRVHALKFPCVALPNGLIGHLYGPVGKKWLLLFVLFCHIIIYIYVIHENSFEYFFYFSEGWRHDAGILAESQLLNDLQASTLL